MGIAVIIKNTTRIGRVMKRDIKMVIRKIVSWNEYIIKDNPISRNDHINIDAKKAYLIPNNTDSIIVLLIFRFRNLGE